MSFGRFKGGQHFTKQALKEMLSKPVEPSITSKQIDFIRSLGVSNEYRLDNLTKSQGTLLIKALLKNKEETLKKINARCG